MGYDLNSLSVTGRLGADPEVRFVHDKTVCNFNLAVSSGDDTTWLRVAVWGKSAEACGEYLAKGSRVAVKGRLKVRDYTTGSGEKGRSVELDADSFGGVVFLDTRGATERSATPPDDDEIPF